jgi:hypothetical protein
MDPSLNPVKVRATCTRLSYDTIHLKAGDSFVSWATDSNGIEIGKDSLMMVKGSTLCCKNVTFIFFINVPWQLGYFFSMKISSMFLFYIIYLFLNWKLNALSKIPRSSGLSHCPFQINICTKCKKEPTAELHVLIGQCQT